MTLKWLKKPQMAVYDFLWNLARNKKFKQKLSSLFAQSIPSWQYLLSIFCFCEYLIRNLRNFILKQGEKCVVWKIDLIYKNQLLSESICQWKNVFKVSATSRISPRSWQNFLERVRKPRDADGSNYLHKSPLS